MNRSAIHGLFAAVLGSQLANGQIIAVMAVKTKFTQPGKLFVLNDGNEDADGVPNFADGYNLFVENEGPNKGGQFTPLVLEVPLSVDPAQARVRFTYSCSDPALVQRSGAGTPMNPFVYTPAPGHLRIWTKDGSVSRSKAEVDQSGGHFVKSNSIYTVEALGTGRTIPLWVEGIAGTTNQRILVELDPYPSGEWQTLAADAVRVSVVRLELAPAQAYACAGTNSPAVTFSLTNSHAPGGVNWTIEPAGLVGGALLSNAGNSAVVVPGTVPTNYTIRAFSMADTNFNATASLGVLRVEIMPASAYASTGSSEQVQFFLTNYYAPSGVVWILEPDTTDAVLEDQGDHADVSPGTVPTNYTIRAISLDNTNCNASASLDVFKADLEIYKPKVVDALETMIPDADATNKGSMTFVNLDNDDNDGKFDYGGVETNDDIVMGGDNELVKIVLKLQPKTLTDGTVILTAPEGAANIAVWTNNEKKASSAYTLGTGLSVSNDFTVEGDSLVKTMWVEGILAHTVQRGTMLKMEYTVGVSTASDEAALTVIGVDQVKWTGKGNSVNDDDTLLADPNWPSGLTPNALRVFPDARVVGGTVEANPRDKVGVEVTLTVEPPSEIKIYLDSFDVDDPTAVTNVVDNETAEKDNRGLSPAQDGKFAGESGGIKELVFPENVKATNCEFQLTMQPGDNFRVVANADKDFLLRLENKDSMQNVGANDAEKNANKQFVCSKDVTGTPAEREIRIADHYASDTLTVWRFLHVEVDSMTAPPTTGAEKNTVDGNITAVAGNGTVAQRVTLSINLKTGLSPQDNSANLSGTGNGRFENGWVKIGSGSGTPGETTTTNLLGNGDDFVRKDAGIDIPILLSKTGEPDVSGKIIAWNGSTFTLSVSSGTLTTSHIGGTLNVAGVSMTVSTISTNGGVNIATVTATANIPFMLHDDDVTNDVPEASVGGMGATWKDAYVRPQFDTGNDTPDAIFRLHSNYDSAPINYSNHLYESRGSTFVNTERYWSVQVKCGFQTDSIEDNDPDNEGTWRGVGDPDTLGAILLEESIRDWIATPTALGGAGGIDPDTSGQPARQTRREEIVNHEVGHLFILFHPVLGEDGGVMEASPQRQASTFVSKDLDKIRKKKKPGPEP